MDQNKLLRLTLINWEEEDVAEEASESNTDSGAILRSALIERVELATRRKVVRPSTGETVGGGGDQERCPPGNEAGGEFTGPGAANCEIPGGGGEGAPTPGGARSGGVGPINGIESIGGVPIRDWLDYHGISEEVFKTRGYIGFDRTEGGHVDPAVAAIGGGPGMQARGVALQSSGVLIPRQPIPGSPYGPELAQIRPDEKVVDLGTQSEINYALSGLNRRNAEEATPRSGFLSEEEVSKATGIAVEDLPDNWQNVSVSHLQMAQQLSELTGIPVKELPRSWQTLPEEAKKTLGKSEEFGSKYLFPPGEGNAKRVEINHDPENLKNFQDLTGGPDGKGGRVVIALEGNLKSDALVTEIKKRGLGESVISVPSVTLWSTEGLKRQVAAEGKNLTPEQQRINALIDAHPEVQTMGEMEWVARTYLQGREVVIVNDADENSNPAVRTQSRALQALLENNGVGKVFVAAPPLGSDNDIIPVTLPNGKGKGVPKEDHLKGVDDYLGGGNFVPGVSPSLDKLDTVDRSTPDVDLTGRVKSATGRPLRIDAQANAESVLRTISTLAGPGGVVKSGLRTIASASGVHFTTADKIIDRLVAAGLVKKQKLSITAGDVRADPSLADQIITKKEAKALQDAGVLVPWKDDKGKLHYVVDPETEAFNRTPKTRRIRGEGGFAEIDNEQESYIYTIVDPALRAVDKPKTDLKTASAGTSKRRRVRAKNKPVTPAAGPRRESPVKEGIPRDVSAGRAQDLISQRTQRIKSLYEQGKTQQEIADELGISQMTVSRALRASILSSAHTEWWWDNGS